MLSHVTWEDSLESFIVENIGTALKNSNKTAVSPYYIGYVVFVVDHSHIQRIVLATEETTAIQQVSHRPIKYQSRFLLVVTKRY